MTVDTVLPFLLPIFWLQIILCTTILLLILAELAAPATRARCTDKEILEALAKIAAHMGKVRLPSDDENELA